jgi:hypothetical protein
MGMLQKITQSTLGKVTVAVVLVVVGVALVYQLRNLFGVSSAAAIANDRIFICSETHKPFHVNLEDLVGKPFPIYSSFSGKNTGYPAELCYWTADGKPKSEPTAVLMNSSIGKPGPTFCPDCGRLVVGHNPMAVAGATPPPTEAEYNARYAR